MKETSKDAKAVMAAIGRSFDSAEPLGTRTYSVRRRAPAERSAMPQAYSGFVGSSCSLRSIR